MFTKHVMIASLKGEGRKHDDLIGLGKQNNLSLDTIVVELVVRSQGRQGPSANTVGKEDLRSTVNPSFGVGQFGPVWSNVTPKTHRGTG